MVPALRLILTLVLILALVLVLAQILALVLISALMLILALVLVPSGLSPVVAPAGDTPALSSDQHEEHGARAGVPSVQGDVQAAAGTALYPQRVPRVCQRGAAAARPPLL